MLTNGIIKEYRLSEATSGNWIVKMNIYLPDHETVIESSIHGPVNMICTKLNAIPFNKKPVIKHLQNTPCLLYREANAFHFYSLQAAG